MNTTCGVVFMNPLQMVWGGLTSAPGKARGEGEWDVRPDLGGEVGGK